VNAKIPDAEQLPFLPVSGIDLVGQEDRAVEKIEADCE
jgi:hypothetical protein